MSTLLLDTNIVSALRRVERLPIHARAIIGGLPRADCFVSVISLMEIELGIRLMERRDARQGAVLRQWIVRQRAATADDLVLPVTEPIALQCATLHVPDPKSDNDALIAATAIVHDLTLVTRNVSDFAGIEGLRLLDPWAAG